MKKWIIKFTCQKPLKDMYWAGWGLSARVKSAKEYSKGQAIRELDKLMEEFNNDGTITRLCLADFTGAEIEELEKSKWKEQIEKVIGRK